MDIEKMEQNGTVDYYLELKKYIQEFVDRNYPLSQDDMRSIVNDRPNENVQKRQRVSEILNEAMMEALKGVSEKNENLVNRANVGDLASYQLTDFQKEIFALKQQMLEVLWSKQHGQDSKNISKEVLEK